MKKLTLLICTSAIATMAILHGCKKDEPTPTPTPTTGTHSFWVKTDLGQGPITVTVDGNTVGSITQFHSNGITCGEANVNAKLSPGNHIVHASAGSLEWNDTISVTAGQCNSTELTAAGGGGIKGSEGNPRFNLQFSNPSQVDLDLYVETPNGTILYYGNQSGDGGELDLDCLCGDCPNGPNENIFWSAGTAPHGTYKVHVEYYGDCDGNGASSNFTLRILNMSTVVKTYTGTLSPTNNKSATYNFTF